MNVMLYYFGGKYKSRDVIDIKMKLVQHKE